MTIISCVCAIAVVIVKVVVG